MNKFSLGDRVALIKTQDTLLGTIIGMFQSLKYLYANPMHVKDMAESWSKYIDGSIQDILAQNVYVIKLDKKILPGTMEEAETYRDKFPDKESFLEWIEGHKVDRMSTFEGDLIATSDMFPDTIPEGI